jgi:hypothetical protein
VLAAVTGLGELPEVWERISAVAQKVLPHDALVLAAALPDRGKARVYASSAPGAEPFSDVVEVPPAVAANRDWEYDLVDDLQNQADQQHLEATQRGYRSALRVPLPLDGEPVAAFAFLSNTPAKYVADVQRRGTSAQLLQSFARERRPAPRKQVIASERASRLKARPRSDRRARFSAPGIAVVGDSLRGASVNPGHAGRGDGNDGVVAANPAPAKSARFIHRASPRKGGPFVALNCAALPSICSKPSYSATRARVHRRGQQQAGQPSGRRAHLLLDSGRDEPASPGQFLRGSGRAPARHPHPQDRHASSRQQSRLAEMIQLGQFRDVLRLNARDSTAAPARAATLLALVKRFMSLLQHRASAGRHPRDARPPMGITRRHARAAQHPRRGHPARAD